MSKKVKSEARRLDTGQAGRGVWLVKVPNYLSEAWERAGQEKCLGVLRIGSKKPAVLEELTEVGGGVQLPQQHRIVLSDTGTQSLCAFSEDQSTGSVVAEGKVLQRAAVQPTDLQATTSSTYMKLKKHQIHEAGKTKFTAQHLTKTPVNTYKPVARHTGDAEYDRKKQDMKRARDDKGKVYDLLFNAFQHHQYYSFKDLVNITKQPPVYLKEVLRELCVYNTRAPHKSMWELKGEYKHTHSSSLSSD